MIEGFFVSQLDYIFFFYGLGFIFLAMVCLIMNRLREHTLPWFPLALFGFLHGTSEWLDMLLLSVKDDDTFAWIRFALMTGSFLLLFEFGRAGLRSTGVPLPGRWVLLLFPFLACLGGLEGLKGLNITVRYAIAFPGAVCAAYALYRYGRSCNLSASKDAGQQSISNKPANASLSIASSAMFLYAITSGLIVPQGDFVPSSWLNYSTFLSTLHFPVQLLRGMLAITIAASLWWFSRLFSRGGSPVFRGKFGMRYEKVFLGLFLLALLVGWA